MKEWMVWAFLISCLYFIGYILISTTVSAIWSHWAMRKTNIFIRYNLRFSIRRFCPRYYHFTQDYNWLYSIMYVMFWPVMIPFQYTLMTNAVKNSLVAKYY